MSDGDGDGTGAPAAESAAVRNAELADRLAAFADLLEATGVEYKPSVYRRAAENVREYPESVAAIAREEPDRLEEIDRVGEAIAGKLREYVETGTIEELEELRAEFPVEMAALTRVEGVGPRTVARLYEALGITDLDDLEAAAGAGEIREVEGFGETSEQNILDNVAFARQSGQRRLLSDARPLADDVLAYLDGHDAIERAEVAGSLRRWRATIGDVDVLVAAEDAAAVEAFTDWPGADEVIEAGEAKASVRAGGVRVDLRAVVPEEFGAALQYFTGSKDHNVHLRNVAIERDLKINEYGLFDVSGITEPDAGQRVGELVAAETEEAIYDALGMETPAPELRENRGEIEGAFDGTLPDLIAEGDLRGDLHTHTDWTDGRASIEEMIAGAEARGLDYVAITDHASGPGVRGFGLSDGEVREQAAAVQEAADDADVTLFTGVEANVGADGSVSVADDVLADLDVVVASPHSGLDGDGTDRLIAAAEHPGVDVVGHPTGRLLNERPGLDVDVPDLAAACADAGTALEVNANPSRLDLHGSAVRAALEAGATVAVNTDAHHPSSLDFARYGVHTARRGWAEAGDVLNARPAGEIRSFLS
jgi:DNA polymerase (family 10)